jgi:hypothetical protein
MCVADEEVDKHNYKVLGQSVENHRHIINTCDPSVLPSVALVGSR